MSQQTQNIILDDILNTPVGSSKRHLIITDVTTKEITTNKNETRKKVDFKVEEISTGKRFNISDAYVNVTRANLDDRDSCWTIQGLWVTYYKDQNGNKTISSTSALAKLLNYYKVDTVSELIDKEVIAFPDKNNFLIIVGCNLPDSDEQIFQNLI